MTGHLIAVGGGAARAEGLLDVEGVAAGVAAAGDEQNRGRRRALQDGVADVVRLQAVRIVDRDRRGAAARRTRKDRVRRLIGRQR